jgi:hypothetical protein
VQVTPDKNIAKLGPGGRWGDVLTFLNKEHLTVSGGRMGPVGVGGFLTGGGISYLQGSYGGWACDSVMNHEVSQVRHLAVLDTNLAGCSREWYYCECQ